MVDAPDRGLLYRRICFAGILALQMFAVLAYGAVEYWSVAVVRMGSLVLFAVWVASVLAGGSLRLRRNPLFFPMGAFIGWVGLQYLTKRTVYLPSTREALLTIIADFLLFFVLVNTVDGPEQKRLFVFALVIFGAAVAVLALAQDFSETHKFYWVRATTTNFFGPYANKNHFAGFMMMLALMPLALLLGRAVRRDKAFVMLSLTGLMFVAVLFSRSRGGLASFVAELVLLGFLFSFRGQIRNAIIVAVAGLLLAAFGAGVGMTVLRAGFSAAARRSGVQSRSIVWRESLPAIRDNIWTGTGFGTFWVVYPRYRQVPSDLRWNETHNDYLQVLFETGLPGFLIAMWFLWRLLAWVIPRLFNDADPEFGVILGVSLGIFGILCHSLVDFNLQLPANGMLFLVLCGLATA
jgi:O-antigen ligase